MCAIIGIANVAPVADRGWLTAGRDAMRHRGPDGHGEWWSADGRVGLGHRRLAIIDLSSAGAQPMTDGGGELRIVFNGEIYNFHELRGRLAANGHRFHSASDTEVILAAYREWGTDCLSHLNGMFAFALYDARSGEMLLARDRAGEKPLFYALTSQGVRFASELKGLMADPGFARQLDAEALDCYLAMGFVPGARCILRGVSKLPPAHALLYRPADGRSRIWRYWQLPAAAPTQSAADDHALSEELESLLEDSVRRQLVADVPVGVLLSGGVDSSLVTAMAARSASHIKTFTVRFPGFERFDETRHARLIAQHFATEHLELDAAEATVELLPRLALQFDEPLVDSSMIPTFLLSQLVREHCTVALGGDGGDELFAGYHHYDRLLWMQQRMGWIPVGVRRFVAAGAASLLPLGFKGRNYLQGLAAMGAGLPLIATCLDRATRAHLMRGRSSWPLVAEHIRRERVPADQKLLQRATRMDFENYLADDILVKVDRASMLNSLEIRAPLLDYRLIEFAFGRVPEALRATPRSRKVLLKQLAARVLPPQFDRQRKQGFSIPLAAWLKSGPWRAFFRDVLLGSEAKLFDRTAVAAILRGQERGRGNSERLFALVMFELWRREYQVQL